MASHNHQTKNAAEAELTVVELVPSDEHGQLELSFPNLATAIEALIGTLRSDEAAKVKMARIIDAIDRQQLYKEAGITSMAAFFPLLLAETEKVGWKSSTSIKRYLAWYRIYIRSLSLDSGAAIRAVSHLHNLKVLAEVRADELVEHPVKGGKLGARQFEDVARLIVALVNLPSKEQQSSGLDAKATSDLLSSAGLVCVQTYKELMGRDVILPVGGWSLSDTQEIIDRVRGGSGEGSEEKLIRVWLCDSFDGRVYARELQFWVGGELKERFVIEKDYSPEEFKKLSKGDKVVCGEED